MKWGFGKKKLFYNWRLSIKVKKEMINKLLDVMFPRYCLICDVNIYEHEKYMCTLCESEMPLGYYSLKTSNPVERTFWGRCNVESASAYIRYRSDSQYSNLIKSIKYDDGVILAQDLGYLFGNWVKLNGAENHDFDCLVPIPLHKKKLLKRGYNQSEEIAKGISKSLGIPIQDGVLFREKYADSQTHKNRYSRWENTAEQYTFGGISEHLKHLVLVDDVITTGATIEACIREIHKNLDVKVSVLALGFTQ